jgi:hypothetical protein
MKTMKKILALTAVALVATAWQAAAQVQTSDSTKTITVTVQAEANISVDASVNFAAPTSPFADYTATTNYHWQVRTSTGGSGGDVTVAVTEANDFSSGGSTNKPSANNPPTTGDALTITASTASAGNAAAPPDRIDKTAQNIVTFGKDFHAGSPGTVSASGATGSVNWKLTNDPVYPTGSYIATPTFTISAT